MGFVLKTLETIFINEGDIARKTGAASRPRENGSQITFVIMFKFNVFRRLKKVFEWNRLRKLLEWIILIGNSIRALKLIKGLVWSLWALLVLVLTSC